MNRDSRILVAGAYGLVGSAISRRLAAEGFTNVSRPHRSELDYMDAAAVDRWFAQHQPEYVFMAAARVGGILANMTMPVEFIRENLLVQLNLFDAAFRHRTNKTLFLGSSCIYPRQSAQPIREEYLLTGPLEPTNEAYAIAKIAGVRMAQYYHSQYGVNAISAMPTNLFGPGDDFDPQTCHVMPALLRRFYEAARHDEREVVVWGTGTPRREFLYVDDLASAVVFLMKEYDSPEPVNVGTGTDISIRELAELMAEITGYRGRIVFDTSRPDGMPRKLLDCSRIQSMGWRPETSLRDGIRRTIEWYASTVADLQLAPH
jgi:GDP-L-fucose synthase